MEQIALALHMKGFSMGALVVFLMSGPATNIATISVAIKQLGKKSTIIYLSSIIICSIAAGLVFDFLFPGLRIEQALNSTMKMLSYPVKVFSAIALLAILSNAFRATYSDSKKSKVIKGNVTLYIEGMTCNHCVETITKTLDKLSGVKVLNIDLKSGRTEINCLNSDIETVKKSIISLNYKIKK